MRVKQDHKAIVLSDVSVQYRLPTEKVGTLKEHLLRVIQRRRVEFREFWALRNIYLEVRQGETLGIVGRNGAGKSTLLKVISRILRPTEGRAWVRGKLAPLIELGAGFHPELTGRENIYLNGAMLGFSKSEMEERSDRIIKFSELENFIDAPIRTYSSGMNLRLGFSIATEVFPDILIVDEVMAVGDAHFQEKCHLRMQKFRETGTTILFVSHSLPEVQRLCDRAIWIEAGCIRKRGAADKVIDAYRAETMGES